MTDDLIIRPARDDDAEGLIALIGGCFAEYEGCAMDLEGIDSDLKTIETVFRELGGKFWVMTDPESDNRIVASVGFSASSVMGNDVLELKKLYVSSDYRRRGIATRLLNLVLDGAEQAGAPDIDLWSDTRFVEAHAFYRHHGFKQLPGTRELHDPSNSVEYYFVRQM